MFGQAQSAYVVALSALATMTAQGGGVAPVLVEGNSACETANCYYW